MWLQKGKVPADVLKRIVFRHLGAESEEVILGPSLGVDCAIVKVGNKVLISSMDPITGAAKRIGWLAVNVNANDVATFGVRPSFFSSCLLLPEKTEEEVIQSICKQMDFAAKRLGIAIIGGHSEVTPRLDRPIVVGCAMGVAEHGRYVTSGGSEPGNQLILTKGAGIEGTAILATEKHDRLRKGLDEALLESAEKFYDEISVVEEATLAFDTGGITAMHDPTEGGVAGGIHEMADAAGLGVKVFREKIQVQSETSAICEFFKIDPLQLISSGALLISAKPRYGEKVVEELTAHRIGAAVIGEFLNDPAQRILVQPDGTTTELPRPISDHLWAALER